MMTILPQQPAGRRRPPVSFRWVLGAAALVAVIVAVAILVATRGGGGSQPNAAPGPTTQPHSWRAAVHAVSQPAPVGDAFVVYAAVQGKLELIGLDAASGRTAWTVPASPSGVAPGTPPRVAVIGSHVAYLQSVGGLFATVTVADAATGATAWRSPAGLFTSWPNVCADDATMICVSGRVQGASTTGVLRFDAATGRLLPSPQVGPSAREIGADLFDAGQRNPEVMVATKGSNVVWHQPLRSIFTLSGASTDYGWDIDRIARDGLYVGSVGNPPVTRTDTRYVFDLSQVMTAGFTMSDGSARWRDRGLRYLCGFLACPGAMNPAYSSIADAQSGGATVGLGLRAHGTVSGSTTAINPTVSKDARGVLEGFEPATDHVRWTFDVRHDAGLLTQTQLPPQLSNQEILLPSPSGHPVGLNLVTGARHAVVADTVAWCSKLVTYRMTVPYRGTTNTIHQYAGQYGLTPCTPAGRPTQPPPRATAAMRGLLVETDGVVAWMQAGSVVAVPS